MRTDDRTDARSVLVSPPPPPPAWLRMDQHFDGGWDAPELQLGLDQQLSEQHHNEEQQQQHGQHEQGHEPLYSHEQQQQQQQQQQPEASRSHSPQTEQVRPGKPQTTKRARAAGEARRKVDPRFICPIENCGATFTRYGELSSMRARKPIRFKRLTEPSLTAVARDRSHNLAGHLRSHSGTSALLSVSRT
jgi:hypothetical protein